MGKCLADHVRNRPVSDKTASKFTPHRIGEEQPELRRQRFVQAKARTGRSKALFITTITFKILRRVAGQHAHQSKRQNIDAKERWNKLDDTPEKVLKHWDPKKKQEGRWWASLLAEVRTERLLEIDQREAECPVVINRCTA